MATPYETRVASTELLLRVISSSDPARAGQEIRLASLPATIGRDDSCTVVIKDSSASRKHARVEFTGAGFRVIDNGSANGLWVAGKRVAEAPLTTGAQFKIGDTVFECQLPGVPATMVSMPTVGSVPPPTPAAARPATVPPVPAARPTTVPPLPGAARPATVPPAAAAAPTVSRPAVPPPAAPPVAPRPAAPPVAAPPAARVPAPAAPAPSAPRTAPAAPTVQTPVVKLPVAAPPAPQAPVVARPAVPAAAAPAMPPRPAAPPARPAPPDDGGNERTMIAGKAIGFTLKVVESAAGLSAGQEIAVRGASASIGRGDDCAVVLKNDQAVSRHHARVEMTREGIFRVVDTGSANGVWIGDKTISEPATLRPGAKFRVGTTTFELVPPAGYQEEADTSRTMFTRAPVFLLKIVESKGGQAGKEFKVATGFATLGRGSDATIVLQDTSASRIHAKVVAVDKKTFKLSDNNSSNGVWIGDRKVTEETIQAGVRFRIGDTVVECQPEVEEKPAFDPSATGVMTGFAELMAKEAGRRLEKEGEAIAIGGAKVILLDDPTQAFLVKEGKLELFTVAVEDGKPLGTRTHFLTVPPGQMFFGMDLTFSGSNAFVAVGKMGTEIRQISVERLRQIAGEPALSDHVAGLVDKWIEGLSSRLTREIPAPPGDVVFDPAKPAALAPGKRAKANKGVAWIEAPGATLMYAGMGIVTLDDSRPLFPLTPRTWLELPADAAELTPVVKSTGTLIKGQTMWAGLDLFQQVLCECEFINKKLAVVDEFQRLKSKAKHSEAAKDAALGAIGAVMAGTVEAQDFGGTISAEPVYRACRIIGDHLGIVVKNHPDAREERTFEENLLGVASASRFRTRKIVLFGAWFKRDNGPLVGQIAATRTPVALIPATPTSYDMVDPSTNQRTKMTGPLAATLAPFGYSIYRPFPLGDLGVKALMRFGAHGLSGDFWMVVAMGVTTGLLGTVTPYFTGQMIDTAIPEGERGLLIQYGLGMLMAALATAAFKITQSIGVVRISGKMDYSLQAALWDRLLDLPSAFFRKYGAGDLADRAGGINAIRSLIAKTGVSGVLGSISSVFYVGMMFYYSPPLAGVAMLLTFTLVALTTFANYRQLTYQREEQQMKGRISAMVLQLVMGVSKVRVCAAENHAFRVWATKFSEQRKVAFKIGRVQNVVQVFSSAFPTLSSLAIFFTLWYLKEASAAAGEKDTVSLTTGAFIAFNSSYGSFTAAIQSLSDASLDLLRVVPIYERLKPILDAKPETDDSKLFPAKLRGEISMTNVSFRYTEDGPWILRGINLKIEPGQAIAFVGASGGGKSTLMRLMLGFEKATQGIVAFDGQDISTLDVRLVRAQLGVVLQESRVLPTDIYRNIVGTSSRTQEEAWEAAEMAGLADDVREMPMGMHTVVSEGGGTFSGGQRQRLLIARALVNKPQVIFFDEATSALDNKTQAQVTESMDRLDATRIVIAHRLSTVINSDCIYYLEAGQVKEKGTYAELMKIDGGFAELAKRQVA